MRQAGAEQAKRRTLAMEGKKPTRMDGVLKTAFVVGVAIAVETLVLRRLFTNLSWGIALGIFLVASLLLVALQYIVSKRYAMHAARHRRHRRRQEPSPVLWNGLDPSSVPTTHHAAGSNHKSGPPREPTPDSALLGEDGIISRESSQR